MEIVSEIAMLVIRLSSQVEFPRLLLMNQPFNLVSDFSAVPGCSETAKYKFYRALVKLFKKSRTY